MPDFNNLFNKVKEKTGQAAHQMSVATKIAKLKVELATQRGEKDRHLKTIGTKVYAIFSKDKTLDGNIVQEEISNELSLLERIEKHISDLEQEIADLQAEFRSAEGKDVVDASEVKEAEE